MPATGRVLCEKDVAGSNQEVLPFARLEIERSTQRDNELPNGRRMPRERAAGSRLLKGDRRCRRSAAHDIASGARFQVDDALLEMRVPVVARPYPHTSDHVPAPLTDVAFAYPVYALASVERCSIGRNGTT